MSLPDVTVVTVTYRSEATIAACLDALDGAARERSVEVVVVDNASDDATIEVARRAATASRWPIEIVERPTNDGFSVGCNAGLARARGDWVLFLNPDTECSPGVIDGLVAAAPLPAEAGVVAPALVDPDGSLQATIEREYDLARYLLGLVRLGGANRPRPPPTAGAPIAVEWVHAAAILLPTALARELGGLDERFFMYMEDMDLCTRVRQRGRPVVVEPNLRVSHIGGASGALSGGDPVIAERRVAGLAQYLAIHQGRWAALVFGLTTVVSAGAVVLAQTVARRDASVHRRMVRAGASVVAASGRVRPRDALRR